MRVTVKDLVRDQIRDEGPPQSIIAGARYVDVQLNAMTNVELLEYISDAIDHGVRVQWLYRAGL